MTKKTTKTTTKASKAPKTDANAKTPDATTTKGGTREDRVDHRVPIQLLVDYRSGGNYLFDFCRDMGSGGVFIETNSPLAVGSDMELTFTIPDSKETLRTVGKVIWSQAPIHDRRDISVGMGVQFTDFSEQNRKTLDSFIQRYGSQRGGGVSKRRAG